MARFRGFSAGRLLNHFFIYFQLIYFHAGVWMYNSNLAGNPKRKILVRITEVRRMPFAYVRELSTGEILRGSLRLYRQSFVTITLAYALPNLPGGLLYAFALQQQSIPAMVIAWILMIAGSFTSYTAITLCISDACVGNAPSLRRSFFRTRATAASLTVVSMLQVLVIFAGMLALLIPGVIFAVWYFFAPITVILEGRTGKAALSRSRALGKGFYLRNFAVAVLVAIVVGGILFIGFLAIALVGRGMGVAQVSLPVASAVGALMGMLVSWVAYPLFFVSAILTYYDLRARKEAYDTMALAAELAR
jgi:hypothetical protein